MDVDRYSSRELRVLSVMPHRKRSYDKYSTWYVKDLIGGNDAIPIARMHVLRYGLHSNYVHLYFNKGRSVVTTKAASLTDACVKTFFEQEPRRTVN